jgi:hypothetical protein
MKRVSGILVVVFVLLFAVPFLIPTGAYLKQIEHAATEKIGQPVTIASLHLALLPTPRANIEGLSIGAHAEVQVERIAVVPQISTLLTDNKVITSIVVTKPVVKSAALDFIGAIPKAEDKPASSRVSLRGLVIRNAQLVYPSMTVPELNADIMLTGDNQLAGAHVTSADQHLHVDVVPQGNAYAMQIKAQQWTLPAGLPLIFNRLDASMVLQGNRLDIQSLNAGMYQGTLSANAMLDWSKGLRANGKFATNDIELSDAAGLFSKGHLISGRIKGEGIFSVNAKVASAAADQWVLDYKFKVTKGVLHGVDLAKAATLLLNSGEKGGETEFDELTGTLHTVGHQMELKSFKVVSGLLMATGNLKISPSKQLGGKVDVALKKGVALVTVPLQISGTLDHPVILPTNAALAGAAIGTGVLGPGVGTSLGIKAASGLDKVKGLFGGSK